MAVAVVGLCFFGLVVLYGIYENWDSDYWEMFLDYVVYGFLAGCLVGIYNGILEYVFSEDK